MNERVPVAVRAVNTAAVHAVHLSATDIVYMTHTKGI